MLEYLVFKAKKAHQDLRDLMAQKDKKELQADSVMLEESGQWDRGFVPLYLYIPNKFYIYIYI